MIVNLSKNILNRFGNGIPDYISTFPQVESKLVSLQVEKSFTVTTSIWCLFSWVLQITLQIKVKEFSKSSSTVIFERKKGEFLMKMLKNSTRYISKWSKGWYIKKYITRNVFVNLNYEMKKKSDCSWHLKIDFGTFRRPF